MARAKRSLVSTHGGQSSRAWHKSAAQFQTLSTSICLVMITCFATSATWGEAIGTTELFSGNCSQAVNINRALQAMLALLAIGISVSFDFFMRLASSPTVDDLREAHSQGRSLDIAVHSFRNVRHISHWRTFGWITLILLAVPIQLFSHSIAFISFSTTEYSRLLVSEAFTTGQHFAYPGVALLGSSHLTKTIWSHFHEILPRFESASTDWDRLEVSDCRRIYSQDHEGLQSHRNLLVVIETGPDADAKGWTAAQVWNDTTTYDDDSFREYDYELENSLWSFAVYCEVIREGFPDNNGLTSCHLSYDDVWAFFEYEDWGKSTITDTWDTSWPSSPIEISSMRDAFQYPPVKYCLSEPYSAPCKVYISNFFLLVTTCCILLGCTCSTLVARFCWHKEPCQSLGDALQVFLKDGEAFVQMPSILPTGCNPEGAAPPSTRWTPLSKWEGARLRWGQAISITMWIGTYVPITVILLVGSVVLGLLGEGLS